jgi:peptidoglycan/LPS O-acetylase OafA/YrhL
MAKVLKRFYTRRALRIFPLYFGVLLVAVALNSPGMRGEALWHGTYLSNVRMAFLGEKIPGTLFWSLAVEEQFYLVWPWIILWVPRRRLLAVLVAVVCVAPIYRALGHELGLNIFALRFLPFGCLDTLGAGSLLGYVWHDRGPESPALRRLSAAFLGVGLPLFLLGLLLPNHVLGLALGNLGDGLFFGWIVSRAARAGGRPSVLGNRAVMYVGTISYGIYVLHPFVQGVVVHYGLDAFLPPPARPVLWFCAVLLVATCSWRFYERPIGRLKRFLS